MRHEMASGCPRAASSKGRQGRGRNGHLLFQLGFGHKFATKGLFLL